MGAPKTYTQVLGKPGVFKGCLPRYLGAPQETGMIHPARGGPAMVRVEIQKWGQSLDDLRRLALQAQHPRTRERFLALALIADGTHNATTWADRFGRQDETVLRWLHTYN